MLKRNISQVLSSRNLNKSNSDSPNPSDRRLDQIGVKKQETTQPLLQRGCPKGDSTREKRASIWALFLGVFVLSFLIGLVALAAVWIEPTQTPPGGNVPAPLNVGEDGQYKIGGLILNTGEANTSLILRPIFDANGNLIKAAFIENLGNIGIGTIAPNFKLKIYGDQSTTQGIYIGTSGSDYHGKLWIYSDSFNIGSTNATPMRLFTGNTERIRITIDGNVGIGTATPGYKLDVYGTINTIGFRMPTDAGDKKVLMSDANGLASWRDIGTIGGISGSGTVNYLAKFTAGTTIGNSQILDNGTKVSMAGASGASVVMGPLAVSGYKLTISNDASDYILSLVRSGAANPVHFRVGATDSALVINAQGSDVLTIKNTNVGIGTTSPTQKLEINGNLQMTGATAPIWAASGDINAKRFCINGTCLSSFPTNLLGGSGTNNYVAKFTGANTLGNSQIFDNATNVGIGTTGPSEKLQVVGNIKLGGTEGDIKDVNAIIGYNDLFLKGNSAENAPVYITGSQLNVYTGGTSRLFVRADGYVSIGNNVGIDGNLGGNVLIGGNVGIGTTPGAGIKLDVNGDIRTSAGITLGGVRRTTWPATNFKRVEAKDCNPSSSDPAEVIATADCGTLVGGNWVLTGCSGFHEWGYCAGKTCDFRGVIPSSDLKTCTAYAFTRPEGCVVAHAICVKVD